MDSLQIRALGGLSIRRDGETVADFASRKAELLLVYLAANPRVHRRELLADLLWDDRTQRRALGNLRVILSSLRKVVEPFVIITRETAGINPDLVWLDAAEMEAALAGKITAQTVEAVSGALDLYQGDLLAGVHLRGARGFEDWLVGERERLHRLALDALLQVGQWHLEQTDYAAAVASATRLLDIDPLSEVGHRQLMEALARQGQRSQALAQYATCREILATELGVEPSPETEALYEAIRAGEMAGRPAAPRSPRRVYALPPQPTTFIGRQKELAYLRDLLGDNQVRLLTIVGPGGTGKTRLAIEFAQRRAASYRNGAAFVELAPLSDHADIPSALASALDFRFAAAGSPSEGLLNFLANKEMLLLLDNFEHLLDGVGLVADLLQAAPGVRIIATSRARLNLGSEFLFEVGGLDLPEDDRYGDNDGFEAAEAVMLFLEHARRVRPSFAVDAAEKAATARICRLVKGMPLALELAASWVRYLPPVEIVRELARDLDFLESERADLPERQRSMRAAFDHSWKLLDKREREALMKISVFHGGASRQAARAVTGASLRTLVILADHSLLRRDPESGRFAIHELIRQFAQERLEETGQLKQVRDAHSAYYFQALAGRLPDLKGREQLGAVDAIEDDFENVRAAWYRAIRRRQWKAFPEASQSLYLFSLFRGLFLEGGELFEEVRQSLHSPASPEERLASIYTLAGKVGLVHSLDNWDEPEKKAALAALEAAVESMAAPAAVAYGKLMLGTALAQATREGNYPAEAMAALEAARTYYRRTGDTFYRVMSLWRMNYALGKTTLPEEEVAVGRRALSLAKESGNRFITGILLNNVANSTARIEGPSKTVLGLFREAADMLRETGDPASYALTVANLAEMLIQRGQDLPQSRLMLQESLGIASELKLSGLRLVCLQGLAIHKLIEGDYDDVLTLTEEILAGDYRESLNLSMIPFMRGVALFALGNSDAALPYLRRALLIQSEHSSIRSIYLGYYCGYCGVILARRDEYQQAAELIAFGLTDPRSRGALAIDPLIGRTRADLEEILGKEGFTAAWERGKVLNPLVAVEEVLQALETDG